MDFFSALKVSSTGLSAQRTRMNIISSNLANAQSTAPNGEGTYRRRDILLSAVPSRSNFNDLVRQATGSDLKEVKVTEIAEDMSPPKRVFDPKHQHADKDGFVSYPNINVMEEMVNLIMASRSYEANVTAINATKSMALKALEIGS